MFFITNSRQNKQKKERRVSVNFLGILFIIAFTKQKKKKRSKDFLSFSFSLSLLGKNTLSKKAHFVQCTSQRSAKRTLRITLYNHRQHHHLPSKGREREISEISLARAHRARAAQARLGEIQNKKTSLFSCCSYSYLKLTHSIIRWNQSRRTAHNQFIALIIIASRRVLLPSF